MELQLPGRPGLGCESEGIAAWTVDAGRAQIGVLARDKGKRPVKLDNEIDYIRAKPRGRDDRRGIIFDSLLTQQGSVERNSQVRPW